MGEREDISHAEFARFVQEATEQRARAEAAEREVERLRVENTALREALMEFRERNADEMPDGVPCWCLTAFMHAQNGGCAALRALAAGTPSDEPQESRS